VQTFETLIDGIMTDGYGVADDFLLPDAVSALSAQLHQRHGRGQFWQAGVGSGAGQIVETTIRGDEICWLDPPTATPDESDFLAQLHDFMDYLNRTCYLGLRESEFHYARYPAGTFYRRHLDQFRADDRRKLSVVCYLNANWQPADGGQLTLFLPDSATGSEQQRIIEPLGGRLVCFESGRLEHEVRPATRERLSLTGWLKTG
jgi:SM-20-related protein